MRNTGLLISFEGMDGAGKSTHIAPLAAALRSAQRTVLTTREPGGSPLAEQLRGLLLHQEMDALTEALLMFAARRDHLRMVIVPALERGDVVLTDRFTDASFAYQGAGRGFDEDKLAVLEQWVQLQEQDSHARVAALLQPDLTLWFDVAPHIAAQRLAQTRAPDKFEALDLDFFARVAQGYARRAAADPRRIVRIDAACPVEQVWRQVLAACVQRGYLPEERAHG